MYHSNYLSLFAFLFVAHGVAWAEVSTPAHTTKGVVAADQSVASRVGAEVLARGGNAVDAAAASALALGVVNPTSSGIGGGGFAVIYIARERKTYVLDFREVAPRKLTPAHFVRGGKLNPILSRKGGLAVGVPGEAAGIALMVRRFGRMSLQRVVAPALDLAHSGFPASRFLANVADRVGPTLDPHHALAKWLAPGGHPIGQGTVMRRPGLARTLTLLGSRGRDGFYKGLVADDIVRAVTAAGGIVTHDDLATYRVRELEPMRATWRGYEIVTMPLPSSGGLALLEALGILEASAVDLKALGPASPEFLHVVAEVLKHAFADRARFLGDALPVSKKLAELLRPERLRAIAARLDLERTLPHSSYGDQRLGNSPVAAPQDSGTSHLCVVDRDGNAVALTTTVNTYFGSHVVTPRTGIVLNNEIDDFSLRAGVPNAFGLIQSEANLVGPGKRPLSSMTPTLLLKAGQVVGCFGGSGGPRIISNTLQAILRAFVLELDVRAAVSTTRIHHQWLPDQLVVEELPAPTMQGLRKRGHNVKVIPRKKWPTAVQAIVRSQDGTFRAASDPRKGGAPAAE